MLFINTIVGLLSFTLPLELMMGFTISPAQSIGGSSTPGIITVAQSGQADVIGTDNRALQKAANKLRPGDKLVIGPGSWKMENQLIIPCSRVSVSGTAGKTILLKNPGVSSRVIDCGDYGERILVLAEPDKFSPGMGITVQDDVHRSGWDVTVTSIQEITGNILTIEPYTVRDYNYETGNSKVENKFPILSAYQQEGIIIEDIIVDGKRSEGTGYIDGCRGGGIYLYDSRNCTIRNCEVRNYNGDGISFQITDWIKVINCQSHHNSGYGIHPGTGSSNSEITGCFFHHNDQIGFFLCWRVRYGKFSNNQIEHNGRYGISIGHKDTDNLFENNTIRNNGFCGVLFRRETKKLSGHRNVFRNNTISNNGNSKEGYGVYLEPYAGDILFENNVIEETRPEDTATQQYGIYLKKDAGRLKSVNNTFRGNLKGEILDEN